jgi:hypothetical protein
VGHEGSERNQKQLSQRQKLKPSTRSLFQTIKKVMKTTNHAIRDKVSRRWSHVALGKKY